MGPRRRPLFLPVGLLVLGGALCGPLGIGCGPAGPRTVAVSGGVELDGEPLADGDILFAPLDKRHGPSAGKIKAGRYQVQATEGTHQVEIRSTRKQPPPPGQKVYMGDGTVPVEIVPARYNAKSELKAEVTPDGPCTFDFALRSDAKKPAGR